MNEDLAHREPSVGVRKARCPSCGIPRPYPSAFEGEHLPAMMVQENGPGGRFVWHHDEMPRHARWFLADKLRAAANRLDPDRQATLAREAAEREHEQRMVDMVVRANLDNR